MWNDEVEISIDKHPCQIPTFRQHGREQDLPNISLALIGDANPRKGRGIKRRKGSKVKIMETATVRNKGQISESHQGEAPRRSRAGWLWSGPWQLDCSTAPPSWPPPDLSKVSDLMHHSDPCQYTSRVGDVRSLLYAERSSTVLKRWCEFPHLKSRSMKHIRI